MYCEMHICFLPGIAFCNSGATPQPLTPEGLIPTLILMNERGETVPFNAGFARQSSSPSPNHLRSHDHKKHSINGALAIVA